MARSSALPRPSSFARTLAVPPGRMPRGTREDHAVGYLIDGAVAAQDQDEVGSGGYGFAGQFGGVAGGFGRC